MLFPPKLEKGDEVRVIAPSRTFSVISTETRLIANKNLGQLGLTVSFSRHAEEKDEFLTPPIESRINDLHDAFQDKKVKGILTAIGGFSANQLLRQIDFETIKKNPKIFCGYSDITVLGNALLEKTGLVTYSGPHYSTFGMKKGCEYTIEYFQKAVMQEKPIEILPSSEWSDDAWFLDQEKREFAPNPGFLPIHDGEFEGTLVGGNLGSLRLLQGTEFFPKAKNVLLFLEDCTPSRAWDIDRELQSLIHLPWFENVGGLVLGRFQKESKISNENIEKIIRAKKELADLPVIANADFGHTTPHITFPIGGTGKLVASKQGSHLKILKH